MEEVLTMKIALGFVSGSVEEVRSFIKDQDWQLDADESKGLLKLINAKPPHEGLLKVYAENRNEEDKMLRVT